MLGVTVETNITRRGFLEKMIKGAAAIAYFSTADAEDTNKLGEDYFQKIANPDNDAKGDIFATQEQMKLTQSCMDKFQKLFKRYGYGNFAIMDFDEVFSKAENTKGFTKEEKEFMEELFNQDASRYGFLGKKPIPSFTQKTVNDELSERKQYGQFLYMPAAEIFFDKIIPEVEKYNRSAKEKLNIILTSGIRSVPKQTHLFLNKLAEVNGNMSAASRSLAPPGYSWHGAGDFDIGKKGFWGNFAPEFETTNEYKTLSEMGFLQIRYDRRNLEGVRYEPWHVKVAQEPHQSMETYKGIEKLV